MNRTFLSLFACTVLAGSVSFAGTEASQLRTGDSLKPFRELEEQVRSLAAQPKRRSKLEDTLVSMLAPESTYEAKAFACKHLAFVGGNRALPALAKLLEDEQTVGFACLALQGIEGRKAGQVLQAALSRSSTLAKLQIIGTLGDRRETAAVDALAKAALDPEPRISEAAIAALGKIGNREALEALSNLSSSTAPEVRSTFAEALFICAENSARGNDQRRAAAIFTQLLAPQEPAGVRRAAFLELVKIDSDFGQSRILEAIRNNDKTLKPVAIQAARHVPSLEASELFVAELPNLSIEEQTWMLESLAHRQDLVARAALANAVASDSATIRAAAVNAVAETAGPVAVSLFVRALEKTESPAEARQIESGIARLSGGELTDGAIRAALPAASGRAQAYLLSSLATREGSDANRILLEHALSPEPEVAKAALRALTRTATATEASALLKALALAKEKDTMLEARLACSRALMQEKNLNVRSSMIRNALSNARPAELRALILTLLPLSPDSSAWRAVRDATGDPNTIVRQAALETAAEWPNMDAWDTLLDTLRNPEGPAERAEALRALVRLVSEANAKPDAHLMKNYDQLFSAARTDAENKQILGALGGAAFPDALKLAISKMEIPALRPEAAAATGKIAVALKPTHPDLAAKALEEISKTK